MASNAAAAIAVAGVIEATIDGAVAALAEATISGMRMQIDRAPSGAVIVNDAYNANPDSMRAALATVAAMDAVRRVAILGPMAELDDPVSDHAAVMADARELGIDVIAAGTDLYGIEPAADPVAAVGALAPGDVVLVKASRSAGLESTATRLLAQG